MPLSCLSFMTGVFVWTVELRVVNSYTSLTSSFMLEQLEQLNS